MKTKKCFWPECRTAGCSLINCRSAQFSLINDRLDRRLIKSVMLSIAATIAVAGIIGFILIVWPS